MKIIHSKLSFSTYLGILFALVLVFGVVLPIPVQAKPISPQSQAVVLDTVSVEIWPEYDQPSVLVIMHMKLSPRVSLPADMSIRIPSASGKPFAVAWQSSDKALFDMKYTMKAAGDWTEIQFNTPSSDVQIEYYDPGLTKAGNQRNFTFHWSEKYPVQNLTLQIQQPINATDMTFRPVVGSGQPGDDGLTYYTLPVGKVDAGTTFDLAMSYDKPDNTLTNPQQFQKAQANQPVDTGAAGRVAFNQFLPWGVGGLGLLLILAGSLWYWRTGRIPSNQTAHGRPRHSSARQERTLAPASAGDVSFCHQCGKKAGPGDFFCRACGTKLR